MNNHVIETVSLKLANSVTDDIFLATQPAIEKFLHTCDGFINRRLSKGEDGVWLDHIEWASMEAAKAASDMIMKEETVKPFMQAMDMPSVTINHNQLLYSIG